ncbi:hypothetical protein DW714_09150 [Streptococcus anginosus]|nr:hypothetical protein DW714_09150 [Streptococcus anginosus]
MKKRYLKQLLVGFVTVFSLITLIACGSQEKKMSFQRIDQNLQYDLRLTYYYKGDIVTSLSLHADLKKKRCHFKELIKICNTTYV